MDPEFELSAGVSIGFAELQRDAEFSRRRRATQVHVPIVMSVAGAVILRVLSVLLEGRQSKPPHFGIGFHGQFGYPLVKKGGVGRHGDPLHLAHAVRQVDICADSARRERQPSRQGVDAGDFFGAEGSRVVIEI